MGRSVLLLTLAVATPTPAPAQQVPVFPGGVERVVVDVVVLDDHGRPVTGLAAPDFDLTENGVSQEILSFEAVAPAAAGEDAAGDATRARIGRTFAILFDDVHLTASGAERAKAALRDLLTAMLAASDQVLLVRARDGQGWAGRVGTDRESLLAALGRLEGRLPTPKACAMTDEEAVQIHVERDAALRSIVLDRLVRCRLIIPPPVSLLDAAERVGQRAAPGPRGGEGTIESWATEQSQRSRDRMRATLSALERLLADLAPVRGRKLVILASEGFVRDRLTPDLARAVTAASDANAAVYFLDARQVGPGGLVPGPDAPGAPPPGEVERMGESRLLASEGAEVLAEETGGAAIRGGDRAGHLRRLADESAAYYLLGYAPADARLDGRFRAVHVGVLRPGLTVRARRGYYAVARHRHARGVPVAASSVPEPPADVVLPAYGQPPTPEAVVEVAGWSRERMRAVLDTLRSGAPTDDILANAALLHTAAAFARRDERRAQIDAAREAMTLLRAPARRRAFERAWRLGVAARLLQEASWDGAADLVKEEQQSSPEDAEVLLALGIIYETAGSVSDAGRRQDPDDALATAGFDEMRSRNPVTGLAAGVPGGPSLAVPPQAVPRMSAPGTGTVSRMRRAEESYRKALKARPDLAEARLRLGRTLALVDRPGDAVRELTVVADTAGDAATAYLARLFLGDLHEARGDLSGATAAYEAAVRLVPGARVARLALLRARHLAGDRSASLDGLEALVAEEASEGRGDPWWRYRLRPLGGWEALFARTTVEP